MDNFGNFLLQKMYTNNTSNAVIAYTGYLLGYEMIAQAANSPEISKILDTTYDEINAILEAELHVDPQQQKDFSIKARAKYTDWTIVDKVIRHAKDPIRKLRTCMSVRFRRALIQLRVKSGKEDSKGGPDKKS